MSRTLLTTCCASALFFCVLLLGTAARGSEPVSSEATLPTKPGQTVLAHAGR